ncbi:hypothetical protein MKX01_038732, partial [Papaver californicum]
GSGRASLSSLSSSRNANHKDQHDNIPSIPSPDLRPKLKDQSTGRSALNTFTDVSRNSYSRVSYSNDADMQPKSVVTLQNSKLLFSVSFLSNIDMLQSCQTLFWLASYIIHLFILLLLLRWSRDKKKCWAIITMITPSISIYNNLLKTILHIKAYINYSHCLLPPNCVVCVKRINYLPFRVLGFKSRLISATHKKTRVCSVCCISIVIPYHFLTRIIDDEVEKVIGFPVDTILPVREKVKILGRVANVDDLHLNAEERKLMHAYNEKHVLSRPQHELYLTNCILLGKITSRFSYISRKGYQAFQDKLRICILDIGLTIQV